MKTLGLSVGLATLFVGVVVLLVVASNLWRPRKTHMLASVAQLKPTSGSPYERLLKDRIVVLSTPIDDDVANVVIAQLLFLESEDPKRDINLYLNSPGGSVTAGLAILDTMADLKPRVATVCLGQASGMAALILAAGARGERFATAGARITLVATVGLADSEVVRLELKRLNDKLDALMSAATEGRVARLPAEGERALELGAGEAIERGVIDEIVEAPAGLSA
ncbi:MAG: ATP-dependent Clp protease proteolytic subunit [Myxococcales bacterium]